MILATLSLEAFVGFAAPAHAMSKCPESVSGAAKQAYPDSKVSSCKLEKAEGKIQYEVKLVSKSAGKVELDIDSTGSILLTERIVPADSVAPAVMTAFKAKYPDSKLDRAEMQTKADGSVDYELAFKVKRKKHEATFRQDGEFVEEE